MSFINTLVGKISDTVSRVARLDSATHAIEIVDYEHHEIHSGSHFFVDGFTTLNASQSAIFGVQTPNSTKWTHILWDVVSTLGMQMYVYEGSSATWDGTNVSALNNDRNSSNTTSWVKLQLNPTVNNYGTLLFEKQAGSASNPAIGIAGTVMRGREIILKQNTTYLFVFKSLNNSNVISYSAEWYEHTNKD